MDSTGNVDVSTAQIDGGTIDNCSYNLYITPSSFDCNDIGTNSVLVFAADPSNNVSFGSAVVTVVDTINPIITVPSNVTVSANVSCGASSVNLGVPVTWDNCNIQSVSNNGLVTFPLGITTVTWTVTDVNGNSSTATQLVTVVDNTNPTISGPSIYTASAVANCELPNASSGFGIVVNDNCGVASLTNNGPVNFVLGYTSITWTVTDNAGNTLTLNQVINVVDDVDPVITSAANMIVNADSNCEASSVVLTSPTVTDNCTIDTVYNDAPSIYPIGNTTITWTAIDVSGNSSTATQTVTVVDNVNPVMSCVVGSPFSISTTSGVCGYIVNGTEYDPTFSDNCGTTSIVHNLVGAPSTSSLAGATIPAGTTTITWTVTDNSGLTNSCSIVVTVVDNEAPQILNCPSGLTLTLGQYSCGTTPNWNIPTTTDNCGTATIVQTSGPAPTTLLAVGNYLVEYTATDAAGNTSICLFYINVINTTAPVIVCPNSVSEGTNNSSCFWTSDIQVNPIQAAGNCPTVTWSIVNPNLSVSNGSGNAQGFNFSVGTSTITYTITDNVSATQTCSSTITIIDDIAPVIVFPSPVSINADANCQAASIGLVTPAVTDNCTLTSIINNAPAFFPLGSTTVTWTATDNSGNSSTANQLITIVDITAPTINCPTAFTLNNTVGDCGYTESGVALDVTATDNCTISSLTHNNSSAPLNTSLNGSVFSVGTTNVTWTAIDISGNISTCIVPITIIDSESPEFVNCPGNISIGTYTGCSGTIWQNPTATDNCSVTSVLQTSGPISGSNLTIGVYIITYEATDASGNMATCSFTITVNSSTTPVIICPNNISTVPTIPTGCDWISPSSSLTPILVAGNCPTALSYEVIDPFGNSINGTGDASGFTFANGTSDLIYTVTDANGVLNTCSRQIIVIESVDPIIIAPSDLTLFAGSSCFATGVSLGNSITSDNCSVASVTNNAPTTFPLGATSVIWTVLDASGNSSTAIQIVTINDNTNPTITAPAAVTVNANASCVATGVVLGTPTTVDNCAVASVTSNAPATFPLGTTTVTWTVTDNAGNTSTAAQIVTVVDFTAPNVIAPADVTVSSNSACAAFNVALGSPIANDNCSIASTTNNAPSVFSPGTTLVTWTVTDNSGNSTSVTQNVTVNDNTNPTIVVPANITTSANANCGAIIAFLGNTVTADNCTVSSITNNAPATFPLGTTTVVWTVTDAAGNTATASQVVTVNDNTNPTIVNANASCVATGVVLGTATTADNCTVASVTNNAPSTFPLGTTTIVWTVTDAAGNTKTASQIVTVVDITAPIVISPTNVTVSANSSCNAFVVALGTPIVTDNCTVSSITNNAPATFPLGTTTVVWTVTDAAGNTATASQVVTVIASCVATGVVLGTATTADNCTVASVTNNAPATFPLGTTTVTWTVTDAAGNTTTATQTVTVTDTQAPLVTAPANVVTGTNFGCEAIGVSLGIVTASDNCLVDYIQNDAPMIYPLGNTTVTWTVKDASGNTTVVTQLVTVIDNVLPLITAPISLEVISNAGCDATGVNLGNPITSDNCGVASVTNDAPTTFLLGTTTVIWTVTDNTGNIAVLNDITITLPIGSNAVIDASMIDAGTFDNCGEVTFQLSQTSFGCEHIGQNSISVVVSDDLGNTTTETVLVTVIASGIDSDFDGIDDSCDDEIIDDVVVPTGFTPDGDGINDQFVIVGLEENNSVSLKVFNRYGNSVYVNDNYQNDWNGMSSFTKILKAVMFTLIECISIKSI
ncbi:MAG: hypothetical protein RJA13_773 [Bacteroidota bacterium]